MPVVARSNSKTHRCPLLLFAGTHQNDGWKVLIGVRKSCCTSLWRSQPIDDLRPAARDNAVGFNPLLVD